MITAKGFQLLLSRIVVFRGSERKWLSGLAGSLLLLFTSFEVKTSVMNAAPGQLRFKI